MIFIIANLLYIAIILIFLLFLLIGVFIYYKQKPFIDDPTPLDDEWNLDDKLEYIDSIIEEMHKRRKK